MKESPEELAMRVALLLTKAMVMYDKGLLTRAELDGKLFEIAYLTIDPTMPVFV